MLPFPGIARLKQKFPCKHLESCSLRRKPITKVTAKKEKVLGLSSAGRNDSTTVTSPPHMLLPFWHELHLQAYIIVPDGNQSFIGHICSPNPRKKNQKVKYPNFKQARQKSISFHRTQLLCLTWVQRTKEKCNLLVVDLFILDRILFLRKAQKRKRPRQLLALRHTQREGKELQPGTDK